MQLKKDKSVTIQTNEGIYITVLDNPDAPLRSIIGKRPQEVTFAGSINNSSFLYSLPPYITYEESENLNAYDIK